ncbi:IscS subfamily cysteine desulfurase [Aureibacillus halotolerans]|uniref:Cysteine desulfurase n=1 Tax=Aureibacillus halotolerans TaxID=1508390 RepID=A0A4R6UI00_9BACI|nr:IscS subfamily cysteine desulfurase [Aureibacillus halotolerans]TDQ42794.1 cysteine desulfurase [Aureibacillus halotolerans]
MHYFDYAATTPMSEKALQAYVEAARTYYGNTQGLYDVGTDASNAIQQCCSLFGEWLGGEPSGVTFTSTATEANILAIIGIIAAKPSYQRNIIYSPLEHPSIHMAVERAVRLYGASATELKLNEEGIYTASDVEQALRDDTGLVICSHVVSELGFIEPVREIGQLLKHTPVHFHVDAVQSFARLPFSRDLYSFDSCTLSAHKFYGPKGVGILWMDPAVRYTPPFKNITHQNGRRPGTVDVPGILSATTAANETRLRQEDTMDHVSSLYMKLREWNVTQVAYELMDLHERQSPFIAAVTSSFMEGQHIMLELNKKNIAVSTGTACKAGEQDPSKALMARGYGSLAARRLIRVSFSHLTTHEELDILLHELERISEDYAGKIN